MARYLRIYLFILCAVLGMVAGVNFAVDPYATFRWSEIAKFNDQKNLKRDGGRVNKSVIVERYPFDVLFFGSSTAEAGLDPASPLLDGARAFNSSLSNTNIYEIHKAALFAAEHQTPRLVIIGLDFYAFAQGPTVAGDFNASLFAGAALAPIWFKRLLSQEAFLDSVKGVRDSRKGVRSRFPKSGNYDPSGGKPQKINYREKFIGSLKAFLAPGQYNGFRYASEHMALLKEIVTRFDPAQTQVIFFINPYHAAHVAEIAAVGLSPVFERWKRDLTRTLAEVNTTARQPVRLWDFSGVSSITSEPLPDDPAQRMANYWDSNHYTAAVGNLILARILGKSPVAEDFGVELTPANVEAVLAANRTAMEGQSFDSLQGLAPEIERARRANLRK